MRVYGEAALLMNGGMDFLCLLVAARLGRCRFRAGKALISAGLGAVYGVLAWAGKPWLRSVPMVLGAGAVMALAAFGRAGVRLFPLVAGAGWLLAGLSDFVVGRGAGPLGVMALAGAAAAALCLPPGRRGRAAEGCTLRVTYGGRSVWLPALRDTGNLLEEGVSGLPVIVAPAGAARPLLPPGVRPGDLGTLPRGWRLVRITTAAGGKTLMCFIPDALEIREGKRVRRADAVIAVAEFGESRALVPGGL